jgi:hypothetical protein
LIATRCTRGDWAAQEDPPGLKSAGVATRLPDGKLLVVTPDPSHLLGDAAAFHIPILVDVLDDLGRYDYTFMSAPNYDAVLQEDWRRAQQIYWEEILYRAHFAAAASLVRTARWIDAMIVLADADNYTAFMAAYRGCLEASADSFHTFQSVPGWLAEMHTVIRAALAGTPAHPVVFQDLEDALIHFTHARHVARNEVVEATHRAMQTKHYLDALAGDGLPEVTECYRRVCDVTHPGMGSIVCYADGYGTKTGTGYRLRPDMDAKQILEFCSEFRAVSERMVFFGVVPPIMVLRILNDFAFPTVYTPGVMRIAADRHPAWTPFGARLNDPTPPAAERLAADDPK